MTNTASNLQSYDPLAWLKADAPDVAAGEETAAVEPAPASVVEAAPVAEADEVAVPEVHEEAVGAPDVAEENAGVDVITLEADVTIVRVADLHSQWVGIVNEGKSIQVDASAVTQVDTAGMQLLLGLYQGLKGSDAQCLWLNPSDAFMDAVQDLGLADAMGLNA